jgi:hypothetical protein
MNHIREFAEENYRVQLDLSQQVLGLEIPEWPARQDSLHPTLRGLGSAAFVSAAALAMKAKQFDDGLYAATELAAQNGAGHYPGKVFLLRTLARNLAEEPPANATELLAALCGACELGGLKVSVPESLEAVVKEMVADFLRSELRSKPIGFYTWTRDLEAVFRQDRMLQEPLRGEPGIRSLVRALKADDKLRTTYVSYLDLIARLTNPFAEPDLRSLLAEGDKDRKQAPLKEVFFFPPSRAYETDLIKKLFGDRPIPDGFNLMDELIARIRAGVLQLKPTDQSGWYDYLIWSIEPLAIPDRMPEAKRLFLDQRYREHLVALFKGIYALTRETHAKGLELAEAGAAYGRRPRVKKIYIHPELSAEPLATFYLRRALSYRFVHQVLAETFDTDALRRVHRLTPERRSELSLAEELERMEALFYGAHLTVNRQLGLTTDAASEIGSSKGPRADAEHFGKWAEKLEEDEDLGQDARMMVPVFYDVQRRRTKVWLFLGWTSKPLRIYFATPPRVVMPSASPFAGRLLARLFGKGQPDVVFTGDYQELACPVTAEVYVERILNRDEFRSHCDTYKTQSRILENLL